MHTTECVNLNLFGKSAKMQTQRINKTKKKTNASRRKQPRVENRKKWNRICVQTSGHNVCVSIFSLRECFGAGNLSMSTGKCDSSAHRFEHKRKNRRQRRRRRLCESRLLVSVHIWDSDREKMFFFLHFEWIDANLSPIELNHFKSKQKFRIQELLSIGQLTLNANTKYKCCTNHSEIIDLLNNCVRHNK